MYAYCYASGLIKFGRSVPAGALPVAKGPARKLRDFIETTSRHGYRTRPSQGRPIKIAGSDCLLVPGVPEAPDQHAALDALGRFSQWLRSIAPQGITVIVGAHVRGTQS